MRKLARILSFLLLCCAPAIAQVGPFVQSNTVSTVQAPAAVTATTSTSGGAIAAGTYRYCEAYIGLVSNGTNSTTQGYSVCSTDTSTTVTTTGSVSTITMPSPASAYGAQGWIPYIGANAGASGAEYQQSVSGVICQVVYVGNVAACKIGYSAVYTSLGTSGSVPSSNTLQVPASPQNPLFDGSVFSQHMLVWTVTGTVNSCSVELDNGSTSSSFAIAGASQTCTSSGAYQLGADTPANYWRVNFTAFTSASGSVTYQFISSNPASGLANVFSCGATTGGTPTCGNVGVGFNAHVVFGKDTLSSGTAVISGVSPVFTSTSTYYCVGNDTTTTTNGIKVIPTSTSSFTFTGTGSDVIQYICVGY